MSAVPHPSPAPVATPEIAVSVVIPTYRRPALLRRCLKALSEQAFDPHAFEIVVVDDGREPPTRALVAGVAQAQRLPVVRYVVPPRGRRGPAAARNAGWRAARGEVIAFTDDDTVPTESWLAEGMRPFEDGADAVRGRVRVPIPPVPTDWERNVAGLDGAEFVTANAFVRRAALVEVGGFDERFTRAWREDSDLYFSLLERRRRVVAAPAAVVLHPVRAAPWGVSLRQQRNMLYDALLYKKHPRLYRQKIARAAPRSYYATVAALAGGGAAAATGHLALAALAGGTWLALTAAFAARRLRGTSPAPGHVWEMLATSAAIPVLAVFWRLAGAARFRVPFV